ncbi:MAG: DEAD/DEAH box helicase [Phycisphaerales bacterium]|nr:DEAD/DEAH box helicase [Phycisphaerales bacterium]
MPVDMDNLLSLDGALARRLQGFESRPQQTTMSRAVEETFARHGRLLVEAGTGVGKSFAYLLPAIKRVVEHQERVVIATNTITLQEQLIEHDVPVLNAVIPEEFTAVLVKGRGNYLSLRRLKLASERQDRLCSDEPARHSLHLIEDWAYRTTDGTLTTLPQLPRPSVWDLAQSDSHNCMGKKCPTYQTCFFQAARRRMEHGDLLVCNHALFFADLALRSRGVGFLPPYDHVILDEAHGIEDVASEHFGLRLSEGRINHLLNMLYSGRSGKGFLAALVLEDGSTETVDRTIEQSLTARRAADAFFGDLVRWQTAHGPANGRIDVAGIVPNDLTPAMNGLADQLKFLRDRVKRDADEFELNSYLQRARDIANEAQLLVDLAIDGCVYWIESESTGRRTRRAALACQPVDVGPILREQLFARDVSVVLTSATLATGPGDFAHIASRLGCEEATTLQLGSPFDHGAQMRVLVDRSMPGPERSEYVDALVPRIIRQIRDTDGGAFVLFTSFAMLDRVEAKLRPALVAAGYPLLVHGRDGARGLLLKRFKEDERSVLLGTSSFWQGVDVRGRALRNVIITRLPFDVPDRPLVQARLDRIREQGGNPFVDDQLPRAVIRFRQGVGRLIRSTADTGRVVVLDPRIVTKPYGRRFLASLPEGVEVEWIEPEIDEALDPPAPDEWF